MGYINDNPIAHIMPPKKADTVRTGDRNENKSGGGTSGHHALNTKIQHARFFTDKLAHGGIDQRGRGGQCSGDDKDKNLKHHASPSDAMASDRFRRMRDVNNNEQPR